MAFRVARMARARSGSFRARKGIPTDVRNEYAALYGRRWEELFRAPPDCTPQRAKALRAEWEAEIETRFATLRAKQRGEGHDLTQKQARALAGEWYREFTAQHEDNPGHPDEWDTVLSELTSTAEEASRYDGKVDAEYVRETFPWLAREAARFLARKGETLTPAAADLFLTTLLGQDIQAAILLGRRASGDYSPDQHLQTLPVYSRPKAVNGSKAINSSHGQTCIGLFEAFVRAKKPAPSTVDSWGRVLAALDVHLKANGWAIDDYSPDEAQVWASSLITEERSAYTVKNTYVKAARTVLAWARRQKLITANPFADVSIDVPRKAQTREDGKAFSEAEQQTILKAALAIKDTKVPLRPLAAGLPGSAPTAVPVLARSRSYVVRTSNSVKLKPKALHSATR
jgi:hypothetical protein